ncbi:MAG: hypothetical protein JSR12_01280, partial [Bacteroidetes bacterium]|nr:hypothetical protein [Bacteroidota bacterium]
MQEKIKNILAKPIYVYLLGVFFVVYRTMQFPKAFNILIFSAVLAGYFAVVFILLFLFKKVKHIHYWAFCSMAFFLFAQDIFTLFSSSLKFGMIVRYRHVIPLYIILCLLLFLVKLKWFKKISFSIGTNIFFIVITLLNIINGFFIEKKEWEHLRINENRNIEFSKSEKPDDIIWILLDAYASTPYLQNQLHFYNILPESLKSRGFCIIDSVPSRYDTTLFSINSIFNLDDSIRHQSFSYAQDALKNNIYYSKLKKRGYNFFNYEFLDFPIKTD